MAIRRKGWIEQGTREDLRTLPKAMQAGGLARTAIWLATQLDSGQMIPRDAAAYAAQIRHCLVQLHDWAPGEVKGDATDEAREAREKYMLRIVE